MSRIFVPVLLAGLLAVSPLAAQDVSETADAATDTEFESPEAQASYALGVSFARSLREQGIEVDETVMMEGVRDGLADTSKMSPEEVQQTMADFQERVMAARQAEAAEAAKNSIAIGDAYREENGAKEGVVTLGSGLQYEILEAGDGPIPAAEDQVVVHYRGTLVDGTTFDSSYDRGTPVTLGLQRVIKGWTEALQLMPVGSKWRLVIPPELGYGERAGGPIPANSTLLFDVELLEIVSTDSGETPPPVE